MSPHMKVRALRVLWASVGAGAICLIFGAASASAQTYAAGTAYGSVPNFAAFSSLAVGDRGPQVYDLQSFLSEMGYKSGVLPTTYFGPITKTALTAYQRAMALPATGTFGPETRTSISSVISSTLSHMSGGNITVNTGSNAMSGSVSTNGSSVSVSMLAPLRSTGYWSNGNWYNSLPNASTTDIAGYWNNGTWYPVNNVQNMSTSVAINNPNVGYWYNGVWYATSVQNIGGGSSVDANGNPSTLVSTSTTASTGSVNANSTYGMSTSLWNPYPGNTSGANSNVRTCGYETTSAGTQYVCR